jgi:hypothetical protein
MTQNDTAPPTSPVAATISAAPASPALTQTAPTITPLAPTTTVVPGHRVGFIGGIKRFFSFIVWVLTGFGLIGAFRRRSTGTTKMEEIVVYTVHRSFYLWSLILVGFVGGFWVHHFHRGEHLWGWIYIFVLLYTIVSLLFDISTMKALLWGGIFLLVWITSKYLEDMRHLQLLSWVTRHLANLKPMLDPGTAIFLSCMLTLPWIGSLFHSFTRGRKAFSPNSIEEWFMGEGREITDRTGLKFRTRYRDLFETFLGLGAGDLEAINNHQDVVKRWENVLFLAFIWRKLDEILHQRAAVVDNAPSNPVEVEEVKK